MLLVLNKVDLTVSMFEPTQSRFSNMTSARFYLPTSVPMFPYPHHFTASYVSPEMFSLQQNQYIRVSPTYMSQCYHPGMPYNSIDNDKPTQSYIGLIGKAILSSSQQKLVLGDIYNYILTHYPYFRNKGPGWRNSIRHNLSLNDCFVKVGRSPNGKGHFWAINPINYDDFSRGDYKRKGSSRRNRVESSTTEGRSQGKVSGKGEELKTRKGVSKCAPKEMPCNTVSRTNESKNRGFHIETLLSNEKVETHKKALTVVSKGLLFTTQKNEQN